MLLLSHRELQHSVPAQSGDGTVSVLRVCNRKLPVVSVHFRTNRVLLCKLYGGTIEQ